MSIEDTREELLELTESLLGSFTVSPICFLSLGQNSNHRAVDCDPETVQTVSRLRDLLKQDDKLMQQLKLKAQLYKLFQELAQSELRFHDVVIIGEIDKTLNELQLLLKDVPNETE